ncbi:YibE/F family protein [Limihaloglobus sulfuriphilus]|nr:YibE/F family protein [Limihaloglobus sulfuriphilus]
MKFTKNDLIITFIFAVVCISLLFVPTGFEDAASKEAFNVKARIVSADNSDFQVLGIVRVGTQFLEAELLEGPHKGKTISVINQMSGKLDIDEIYKPGEKALIEYRYNGDKTTGYTRGHYRLELEIILAVLFGIFLIIVAGPTGAKALLSFVFAALIIWKLMIPMFLKGMNPLPVAILIVAALTASVSFLVGGLTKKGLVTFIGSFSGLIFTCVLAFLFSSGFNIHGAVRPYAETLLYSGFPKLDLTIIFTCGIFIACSGAVMDLAMDIAASMHEIHQKRPDIHFWEHIQAGLRVGQSVVGTMTTTLLLAYSGGYTTMLMYYMGQGTPLCQFFNTNVIAAEVLNILVGSFGMVAVAPLSALTAGIVYHFKKKV